MQKRRLPETLQKPADVGDPDAADAIVWAMTSSVAITQLAKPGMSRWA
jgi:hypothetical protein